MPDQISRQQHAQVRDAAQREHKRQGGFELARVSAVNDDGTVDLDRDRSSDAGSVGSIAEAGTAGLGDTVLTVRRGQQVIRIGTAPYYRGR